MIHLYLVPIHNTSVSHIKRMHDKEEDNGLKDGLARVAKDEDNKHKLGRDQEKEMGGGEAQDKHGYDDYHHPHYHIHYPVQLLYCCFCISQ